MSGPGDMVTAEIQVIPDGMDASRLRLGLQLQPSPRDQGSFLLADWPAAIAAAARRIRITIADRDFSNPIEAETRSELGLFFDGRHAPDPSLSRAEAASALWEEIFAPVGFDKFYDSLQPDQNRLLPPGHRIGGIGTTRTAALQLFFDSCLSLLDQPPATLREARGRQRALVALGEGIGAAAGLTSGRERGLVADPGLEAVRALLGSRARRAEARSAPARAKASAQAETDRALTQQRLDDAAQLLFGRATGWTRSRRGDALSALAMTFAEFGVMSGLRARYPDEPIPDPEPDVETWGKDPVEACKRKLGALTAIPTLSHYFGLAVQTSIDRRHARPQGVIKAQFLDSGGNPLGPPSAWTAFELADPGYFAPASKTNLFRQGYVDLQVSSGGQRRFALGSADVVSMALQLANAARRFTDDGDGKHPELERKRRGIVLYDRAATRRLEEEVGEILAREQTPPSAPRVLWAQEMEAGWRPDIGIALRTTGNLEVEAARWRPLTARRIRCTHALLDPQFYREQTIQAIGHRDHGFTKVPLELPPTGSLRQDVGGQDEMFAWAGESLAVSRDMRRGIEVSKKYDLGLDLSYDLPGAGEPRETLLPPLREGSHYVCGCRIVYTNGAGPDPAAARAFYAANPAMLLGDGNDRPLSFPPETLSPPDVHLKWDDLLVDPARHEVATRGEASDIIVIRDGSAPRVRIVTPPRTSLDAAEAQQQFDDVRNATVPPGALDGNRGLWLFGEDAVLPEARFGEVRWLSGAAFNYVSLTGGTKPAIRIGSPEYESHKFRQSRGTVAIIGRSLTARAGRFYPSVHGREVIGTLRPSVLGRSATRTAEVTRRSFWNEGDDPTTAVSLLVQLAAGRGPAPKFGPSETIRIDNVAGSAITLPLLRVNLPPAHVCTVELAAPDAGSGAKTLTLKLIHAVTRPLEQPRLVPERARRDPLLGLNAVAVTVRKTGDSGDLPSWAELVTDYELSGADMLQWPSVEAGSTTYFTGRIGLDRRSTGLVRCQAQWAEYDAKTVSRGGDGRWIWNTGRETRELFKLKVEPESRDAHLDLLRGQGDDKALRELSYSFRDGRARELKVKIVATSAFTGFYPEESPNQAGEDWIGKHELQSSRFEDAGSVWTECTFRPPPPKIDRVVPLFVWGTRPGEPESAVRKARLRIHLDEGWFATGAGEQLGIVLLRDNQDPNGVCWYEGDATVAPYHRFITRCGSDPIRDTATEPLKLDATHFGRSNAELESAKLFLGDDVVIPGGRKRAAAEAVPPLDVRVLPYTPVFTEEDGLFVDLDVSLAGSYMPFVQLGLVRFQPHAVEQLKLSNPIEFQVQLIPERALWIEERPGTGQRRFHMEGPGYAWAGGQPRSTVDIQLLEWNETFREWLPVGSVAHLNLTPSVDATSKRYTWRRDFRLPTLGPGPQRVTYALLVEEYEWLPAEEPTGTYTDGRADFRTEEKRRLTFSWIQRVQVPQPPPPPPALGRSRAKSAKGQG